MNRAIAVRIGSLSQTMLAQKDARVGVTHEVLSGIKVVKMRGLNESVSRRIGKVCLLFYPLPLVFPSFNPPLS